MVGNPKISGNFEVSTGGSHDPPSGEPLMEYQFGERVPDEIYPLRLNLELAFGMDVEVFLNNDEYHIYPKSPPEPGEALIYGAVKPKGAAVALHGHKGGVFHHGLTRGEYEAGILNCGRGTGISIIGLDEEFEIG